MTTKYSLFPLLLGSLVIGGAACSGGGGGGGGGGNPDARGGGGSIDGGGGGNPDARGGGGGAESLTITLTTAVTAQPRYNPKNIVAIWIEDGSGAFVKTLARWSKKRTRYLKAWEAASGHSGTDVLTGATRRNHSSPVTASWNIGAASASDGTYTVRVEVADHNARSASENTQGSFTFDLNGTASTQDLSGTGIPAIKLKYSGR